MIHSGDLDAATAQFFGVGHVLPPLEPAGSGFALIPAEPFAHHLQPRPPGNFRHRGISILRMTAVGGIGAGQPALGGIHGEEGFRIAAARRRRRNHRKTAGTGELQRVGLKRQKIISIRQRVEPKLSLPALRPVTGTQNLAAPVFQSPADRRGNRTLQREFQRFLLREHRSRRRRNHNFRGIGDNCARPAAAQFQIADPVGQPGSPRIHADGDVIDRRRVFDRTGNRNDHLLPLLLRRRQSHIRHGGIEHQIGMLVAAGLPLLLRLEFEPDLVNSGKRLAAPETEPRIDPEVGFRSKFNVKPHRLFRLVTGNRHPAG